MKISASAFAAAITAAHEAGTTAGFEAGWDAGHSTGWDDAIEFVVNGGETDAVGRMVPVASKEAPEASPLFGLEAA